MAPLLDAFRSLTPFLRSVGPELRQVFSGAAPLIKPFLTGIEQLVKGLLPGLVSILHAAQPAFQVLAQVLGTLGKDLGGLFTGFAPVIRQSSVIFRALFDVIAGLLPVVGKLAAVFASALAPVFVQLASVIRGLEPALGIIGRIVGELAVAVLKDLVGAFSALLRFVVDITPSLAILSTVLGRVFTVMENAGVFAVLGNALERLAGPLARLVNALVRGLVPVLPSVIRLVSNLATGATDILVRALLDLVQPLTWLINKMPALVPIILGVIAAVKAWRLAQVVLDAVLSANPIGLVITAVGLLVIAIVELVKHWGTIWGEIKHISADAWNFIWNGFGKYLLPLLGPAGLIALGAIELAKHWSQVTGDIQSAAQDLWHYLWSDFGAKVINLFTQTLPDAFHTAVQAIGRAWDNIESTVKTPVNFVITHVIDGLIGAFDWISSKVGGPHIAKLPALATGGRIPGYGGGDQHPALLEAGEAVIDKDRTRMLAPLFRLLGVPGFSGGGIIGGIGGILGGIGHGIGSLFGKIGDGAGILAALATGNSKALSNDVLKLMGGTPTGGAVGDLASLLTDIPRTLLKDAVSSLLSFGGSGGTGKYTGHYGAGVAQWRGTVLEALSLLGEPASLVGQVLFQMQTESGGNPNAINLTDSNAAAGDPSRGLLQTIMTTFLAYAGPFRNRSIYNPLANVYAAINYAIHTYGRSLMRNGMGLGSGHGYANGGPITEPIYGVGASGRAYTFGEHGQEWVTPGGLAPGGPGLEGKLDALIALNKRLITAVERGAAVTGKAVGDSINGASRRAFYGSQYGTQGA